MIGYSGYVVHSDYFIDVHETKESAIEFLKKLAYESDEKRFIVGVAVIKNGEITLEFPELYQYSGTRKKWFRV
jgi:hypothetical protein|nr:MAG TPA: hypothetical protein [Caudoviricetes sp.]